MRIRRANGELVHASEVVPIAERLGLVRLLDHRVLELLVSEMSAVPALRASVNVAPASTTDPDWWSTLGALLRANRRRRRAADHRDHRVRLRSTMSTTPAASSRRVKDLGCTIAIDDFGSGYTSFRNLRKLGVDILKIDGAFVQHLMRAGDDRAFVQALVDLAQTARPEDRRRMGAGRGVGEASRRMGLRLSAGRADRACHRRAAVGRCGSGRSPQDRRELALACDNSRDRGFAFAPEFGGVFPHEQGLIRSSGHRKVRSPLLRIDAMSAGDGAESTQRWRLTMNPNQTHNSFRNRAPVPDRPACCPARFGRRDRRRCCAGRSRPQPGDVRRHVRACRRDRCSRRPASPT